MHAIQKKVEKTTAATSKTSDADLQQTLTAAFAKTKDLKIEELRIIVKDGKALLKGKVETVESVQRATAIAERLQGLRGVENYMTATSTMRKDPSSTSKDRQASGKVRTPAQDAETLITM